MTASLCYGVDIKIKLIFESRVLDFLVLKSTMTHQPTHEYVVKAERAEGMRCEVFGKYLDLDDARSEMQIMIDAEKDCPRWEFIYIEKCWTECDEDYPDDEIIVTWTSDEEFCMTKNCDKPRTGCMWCDDCRPGTSTSSESDESESEEDIINHYQSS